MQTFLSRENRFLHRPLNLRSRILILVPALLLTAAIFLPLWKITLVAPQYQEGLRLNIYAYKIVGGNGGNDLNEINNLNHYIGMRPIREADFVEMKWVPFALGLFVLLGLRVVVHGEMHQLVDLFFLFVYFGVFSMGSFYYRLYTYGHNLDPKAPVEIEPFTPVLMGENQIANFTQWSYPQVGAYLLVIFPVALILAAWLSRKETLDG